MVTTPVGNASDQCPSIGLTFTNPTFFAKKSLNSGVSPVDAALDVDLVVPRFQQHFDTPLVQSHAAPRQAAVLVVHQTQDRQQQRVPPQLGQTRDAIRLLGQHFD